MMFKLGPTLLSDLGRFLAFGALQGTSLGVAVLSHSFYDHCYIERKKNSSIPRNFNNWSKEKHPCVVKIMRSWVEYSFHLF